MAVVKSLLYLFIYPGILFLFVYSVFCEWFDRKLYARLQNRIGPAYAGFAGILQPVADFLKLLFKEDIIPENADRSIFSALPVVGLAIVITAGLYLPLWYYNVDMTTFNSFEGDIIVVLFLLSLPTLVLFLAGWHSTNFFSTIGGTRVLTMLFGYEVPLFLAVLSPAIVADSWRLAEISYFYQRFPFLLLFQIIGFFVAVIALQAKLERTPFDIPHAETEIVGGTFTEYSGKKLAFFRLMTDIEMVVGSGLIAAVFMAGFPGGVVAGLIRFIVKTLIIIALLSLIRAACSRIRIDQVVNFSWKYLTPFAVLQLLISIFVKGIIQ
ncbi:MAG TPA: NADH-quinone oxidoreductase subunit H [Candidatus Ratteibacteria bacterium]|jgi:NADH-quinone oxidoreductase subunit H|uniref:NADH-quinone oxidoreductase subunit H n=1 Tax=candidate division TA06 bacterium ADurb.Bin131 TaxID=1852827 RepID=A0A1V6C5U7_UNCT6|nr:MAG: NADH-quinone oxidoreductase subunit H [candidate division TA06 bacterium ADurb.Bin131]HOC03248.1 NADH-quinone oxidoreductase subunit H [bacterium]HRS06936.1 NADH-quinone oxidoreductase subunit H [Candidatus Ratteibacteria bacterium]HON06105.1 NADH-quinone oxidoreductase subunit H [bacterium]HPC29146.1 NADH-quinone oxidoreductase subunit H [bacterium]